MVKYTKKESSFLNRFALTIGEINQNPNQSMGTRLEKLALEIPNKSGLCFQDEMWTWKEVNKESNRMANYFLEKGLKPKQSIALMSYNSPEYLFLTVGINKIQGISGLINYHQRKKALIHSFKVVEPKFIVVDGDNLAPFKDIVNDLPIKNDQIYVIRNYDEIPHDFMELPIKIKSISTKNPDTTSEIHMLYPAYYIFTSGTTGLPKAIVMPIKKTMTQAVFLAIALCNLTADDVIYITTPLYHNISIGINWMAGLITGSKVVVKKKFSVSDFWEDIKKHSITYTSYVGEIPRYLVNYPPTEIEKNASLKYLVGVGLRKEVWEEFNRRFNVEHIYEYYGLTEGHRCFLNIDEIPGMVGRLTLPGIHLAKFDPEADKFLKDEKGRHIKCKEPGDIGMVLIKIEKNDFFASYKNEEKTRKKLLQNVFRKGDTYFISGDLVVLHEDNWLSFYDRTGDTFRWKGENVSTLEVESIINSHPAIDSSTVFGVSVPKTEGKAGMAAIKLEEGENLDLENFSSYISDSLPNYAIPIFIRLCKEFELTGSFKIIKNKMKNEGYEIENIGDPLYFWNQREKQYTKYTEDLHGKVLNGEINI